MIDLLRRTVEAITPVDADALAAAEARQLTLIKPYGAMGRLESTGNALAAIAGQCPPPSIDRPALLLFAGDHGVTAHGISPWDPAITVTMAASQSTGKAGASVLAAEFGCTMRVIDAGVNGDTSALGIVEQRKIRWGTGDISVEPAMSREEAVAALEMGITAANESLDAGADCLLLGEMGIGNTTPAAALISYFTSTPVEQTVGRGAGAGDTMLERKQKVVATAVERAAVDPADAVAVLSELGGMEIAAMAGAMLAGAAHRVPVVIDGVIACSAALTAVRIAPEVQGYLVGGHAGCEPGIAAALGELGLKALVDLDLRLGEGSGALMAIPVLRASVRILRDMATFDEAGVNNDTLED